MRNENPKSEIRNPPWIWASAALLLLLVIGCEREVPVERTVVRPTVVSLVPSATDLIIGMGAADHLVAVSTFDNVSREPIRGLPRAGDYQDVDWERLTALRPDVMVVFQSPERLPAGLKQKADGLGIQLINIRPERLTDVYSDALKLGEILHEREKAQGAVARLRAQLQQVRQRIDGAPRVRTLLVTSDRGNGVAGRETFLDDLLEIAGGENVLGTSGWSEMDEERLVQLRPEAVIVFLAGVAPQVEAEAVRLWQRRSNLPAVRDGRVYFINRWYALQPGFQLGELAERIAEALHPPAPASEPAPGRDAR